jgi:hypothetical protein
VLPFLQRATRLARVLTGRQDQFSRPAKALRPTHRR